jgi:hypothetical protein
MLIFRGYRTKKVVAIKEKVLVFIDYLRPMTM